MTKRVPIAIRQLAKAYGAFKALDDVSIDVEPGEFLTLLGPSGSGKTTLLMAIAGFVRPDAGSILVGNEEIVRKPPHKREIGVVFQNYALFPHMSVAENVGYPLKLRGVSADERARRVREALDLMALGDRLDHGVDQLSGGQRQRVALARAIVFEPTILLMDEPLSALDKKLREQMQIEIKRLHDRIGTTTVYVTHDQREALTMSDRVAVMNQGRIAQLSDPRSLYDHPSDRFVADFVGESSFLPLERSNGSLAFAGHPILPADGAVPVEPALLVRPEKAFLVRQAADEADAIVLPGCVQAFIFQGESGLLQVDLDGGESVMLRLGLSGPGAGPVPQPGEAVRIGLHRSDVRVVGA
ncbi:ABC transporter ATP-binding protein [Marinivivus vitaminiproducens]|uniref:ABC transporter ATP-binding protein n=1 Tax=Marinivivus vitaminiproducens TaxID=3035935 RepID=UPI0027A275B5|nr:ABC transporter ATP-binding protein [Geminicoccaceae bacterium SCSIO 64248]